MKYNRLLESVNSKVKNNVEVRRYSLPELISESYKTLYKSDNDTNLRKLVEAHLEDVRSNPSDIERLSRQLCILNRACNLVETKKISDEELLVPKEYHDTVEPKEKELEESVHDEDVEETEDEDLLETDDLTDLEVEELAKHLTEIRKAKKVKECSSAKKVKESVKGRNLKKSSLNASKKVTESKSWSDVSISDFSKKSAGKAFVKTFKKLDNKLHEGTALTRQESIALYKAANSAMTHLSVELEHNPEFLPTFNESVSLLSTDVAKLLESMKNGKAPSKSTMKSLAKFSEALLREDEEEELPPIEDEEEFIVDEEGDFDTEEVEDFDQEYADARVELHKELAEEHADSEDPEVQERLVQDAEEVMNLPGITEDQIAEVEETLSDEGEEEESEDEEVEESVHDEDVEEVDEEIEDPEVEIDDSDITDDELEELKRHLTEMRKASKVKESVKARSLKRK